MTPREKILRDALAEIACYPGPNCKANATCRSCPTFRCTRCKQRRPWCVGAGDAHPTWCDGCWWARHRGKSKCATCEARQ